MDDASLDDFLPDDDSAEEEPPSDGASEGADAAEGRLGEASGNPDAEESTPDPGSARDADRATREGFDEERATPTMTFAPDGAPCEGCGTAVTRRWRGEDGLFCGDCLEW